MKALCVSVDGLSISMMAQGELPQEGTVYSLEPYYSGTSAQNKSFHALVQEYWRSGMHSYNATNFEDFRNMIKRGLGEGFESFIYVELDEGGKAHIRDAKTWEEVPEAVRKSPEMRELVRGKLKSWSDYSKKQRKDTLDRLIAEMKQAGVNTAKFGEILSGMDGTVQSVKDVFEGEIV